MYSNGLKNLINTLNEEKLSTDTKEIKNTANEHMEALVG